MGDDAEEALEDLMEWCARWQKHKNPYALRYYAEHLYDENQWDKLFTLSKDEVFASVQAECLPSEPDLPLKTVQTALRGAAKTDNAAAMAEFLLLHAQRLMRTRAQDTTPLDALREGNLQRAWKLADMKDIQKCILWYLLLAWELKETDEIEQARETMERLLEKKLPQLSCRGVDYAICELAEVYAISEDAFNALHHQLLSDRDRLLLCEQLIRRGHPTAACKTAQEIEDDRYRAMALSTVAYFLAEARGFDAALETAERIEDQREREMALKGIAQARAKARKFDAALETTQKIENTHERDAALQELARGLTELEMFDAARETAEKIENTHERDAVLQELARGRAESKDIGGQYWVGTLQDIEEIAQPAKARGTFATAAREAALKNKCEEYQAVALPKIARGLAEVKEFEAALETAQMMDNMDRVATLVAIAQAQAEAGQTDKARGTFATARETAQETYRDSAGYLAWVIVATVQAQAKAGEFDAALETAQEIGDAQDRVEALSTVAQAQAKASEFDAALETAQEIRGALDRAKALKVIAQAQAKAREFGAALETAQKIDDAWDRVEALKVIALVQAETGQTEEARGTFATARETAQEIEDWHRAEALKVIAQALAEAGLATAKTIPDLQDIHLLEIAESLCRIGDREHFKQLLIPCAHYLDAAYRMSGLLALLYPEQATAVARIVCESTRD